MRGELAHYSWSRGYLVYPSEAQALHNTLLLDVRADSLELNLHKGKHTRSVDVTVEHPSLSDSFPTSLEEQSSAVCQISLPRGPAYSRISIHAIGDFVSTTYVVHILRIGEDVTVSMSSPLMVRSERSPASRSFQEERRLSFQLSNPLWYVPDINMAANSTVQLAWRPAVLAPVRQDLRGALMPHVGKSCLCTDVPGFGRCAVEEALRVGEGEEMPSLCVFQEETMSEVHPLKSESSIAGNESDFLQWLQNVTVSGKSVSLLASPEGRDVDMETAIPFSVVNTSEATTSIESIFQVSLPAKFLTGEGTRIIASFTEDRTDVEVTDIPVMIVPYPPPVTLHFHSSAGEAFLLPDWSTTSDQNYVFCGGKSNSMSLLRTNMSDVRFFAQRLQGEGGLNCNRATEREEWLELKAVRKNESCKGQCPHYSTRGEGYDVRVVRSPEACLEEAMKLKNMSAVVMILRNMVTKHSALGLGFVQNLSWILGSTLEHVLPDSRPSPGPGHGVVGADGV